MADAKRSFSWGQTKQRQKEKGTYWSGLSRKWPPFSGNESLIRKLSRNNLPVNPHFPFLFNSFSCGLTSAVRPHHSQATKKRKEKKSQGTGVWRECTHVHRFAARAYWTPVPWMNGHVQARHSVTTYKKIGTYGVAGIVWPFIHCLFNSFFYSSGWPHK